MWPVWLISAPFVYEAAPAQIPGHRCLVNVHGFHHSGTGVTRLVAMHLIEARFEERVSIMSPLQGKCCEAEGQHMQSVYPTFAKRKACLTCVPCPSHNGCDNAYACNDMLRLINPHAQQQLVEDWAVHFDPATTVWIQKTPTFDVLFLDRMLESSQIVVMRHPLQWDNVACGKMRVKTWMQTWNRVFRQLRNPRNIRRWIITRYEGIAEPDALAPWLKYTCNLTAGPARNRREVRPKLGLHHIVPVNHEWQWPKSTRVLNLGPMLEKWFQYSLRPTGHNASGITGQVNYVWASSTNPGPLSNPQFWADWDTSCSTFKCTE